MKASSHSISFCDDLRKTFLKHALIPLAFSVLTILLITGIGFIINIVGTCHSEAETVCESVNEAWEECAVWLDRFSEAIDMDAFSSQPDYRAAVYGDVYQFTNTFDVRPHLYLLNAENEVLFSTERNAVTREVCHSLLCWRLIRNMELQGSATMSLLARHADSQAETTAYWLIGTRLYGDAGITNGYACIVLPQSVVGAYTQGMTSYTIITDQFDNVFHTSLSASQTNFGKICSELRGEEGWITFAGALYFVSKTQVVFPDAVLYTMQNCNGIITMLSLVIGLAMIMLLTIFIAAYSSLQRSLNRKTKIFQEMTLAFQQVRDGDLTNRLYADQYSEFEVISYSYNQMLDSIQHLMEEAVELAQETAISRIKQLESQFNPHFLFNTLETIRYMVRLNPEAANGMILNLATLLRYSIDTSTEFVSLYQDMTFTNCYIAIMQQRFGQRLQYRLVIPDDLRNAGITKLLTQPIIENCLKHCMDEKDVLQITVVGKREGQDLLITVSDNGPGIRADILSSLQEYINNPKKKMKGHIGILNVHERLRLLYGERYGLVIDSMSSGTTVTLRFPYQEVNKTRDGGDSSAVSGAYS